MIRAALLSVFLTPFLSGCYRPWVVIRDARGKVRSGRVAVEAELVDRLRTAALVEKRAGRDSPREYRIHPFLSFFRVTVRLPRSAGGLYQIRPGEWKMVVDGRPFGIQSPAGLLREFRPGLYRSRAYAALLRAVIRSGNRKYTGVRAYPVLAVLPGEAVTVGVLVPRIPFRAKRLTLTVGIEHLRGSSVSRVRIPVPVRIGIRRR